MTKKEALKELEFLVSCSYVDEFEPTEKEALKMAINALKQEPKTGHWIEIVVNGQHKIKCDKCDYIEPLYITHIRNFCPNCGAKMIESEDV